MADDEATDDLPPELMGELLQHLQSDEAASQESTLKSLDSLEGWLTSHPALRQMLVVERFADVGPAILSFLRLMLGYNAHGPEAAQPDAAGPDRVT